MNVDPATIQLVATGFELASNLLAFFSEGQEARRVGTSQTMAALIDASSSRLEQSMRLAVVTIIDKLESDKLEELMARTKNLAMVVRIGRADQAFQYALMLNESVEYARNRVKEGKRLWIGPWLAAHTVFLSAIEYSGVGTAESRSEFALTVQRARIGVLDGLAQQLLTSSPPPWELIAEFARGESTRLLAAVTTSNAGPAKPAPASAVRPEGAPPRALHPGEIFCLGCRRIYRSASAKECPSCRRKNHDNASVSYPLVCLACRTSWQSFVQACGSCSGALVDIS